MKLLVLFVKCGFLKYFYNKSDVIEWNSVKQFLTIPIFNSTPGLAGLVINKSITRSENAFQARLIGFHSCESTDELLTWKPNVQMMIFNEIQLT